MNAERGTNLKKFIFGIILSVIGFIYSFTCFVYAVINPCTVNDRSGFMISLRANNVLIPFLISTFILMIGIRICGYEENRKK